jgi:hypothetical protein
LPLAKSSKPEKALNHPVRPVKNTNRNTLKSLHFALSAVPNKLTLVVKQDVLMMAVPKRLLKRAVDRNAVKRVCREAWRQSCTLKCAAAGNASSTGNTKLVKLVSLPKFDSVRTLKSQIRTDLDFLFAQIK